MFFVYILHNKTIEKYYVGYTSNLAGRIEEHNKGSHGSKYTRKQKGNWVLVYSEKFKVKSEALKRENEIKKWKSKKRMKELVSTAR